MHRNLPAELAALEVDYSNLLAAVDAGQMSVDQALQTLATRIVHDAAGNQWSVSPEADPPNTVFLLTPPGQSARPADPSLYVRPGSATSAPGPAATGAGGFADLLAPPTPEETAASQTWPAMSAGFDSAADPAAAPTYPAPGPTGPAAFGATAAVASERSLDDPDGNVVTRIARPVLAVVDKLPVSRRTVAIVVVGVLCVAGFAALRGGSPAGTNPVAAEFSYDCNPSQYEVPGVPAGEPAALLTCLDVGAKNSVRGIVEAPGAAGIIVTVATSETGETALTFDADRPVTRAEMLETAGMLLANTGIGTPGQSGADFAGIDGDAVPFIEHAFAAGIGDPTVPLTDPVTRGTAAAWLIQVLDAVDAPTTAGAGVFADADGAAAEQVGAAQLLDATGIADREAPAAFGFDAPLDATAWLVLSGRTYYEIHHPGAGLLRVAAQPQTTVPASPNSPPDDGAAPAPAAQPTQDRVTSVLAALTSGDRKLAAEVIANPGPTERVAVSVAQWAGFGETGLTVTSGPLAPVDGAPQSVLDVADAATGTVYAQSTVQWVQGGNGLWVLAEWPTLTERSAS